MGGSAISSALKTSSDSEGGALAAVYLACSCQIQNSPENKGNDPTHNYNSEYH